MTVLVMWIAVAAVTALAALIIARDRGERHKPIDWDAPARDLNETDGAYADARAMMYGAPVVWSDAVPPGGYVCAAQIVDLPGGICGWPADKEPCPQHGPLLLPGGGA